MCAHVMGQQGTSVSLSASLGEMWISMNADGILRPLCARASDLFIHDAAMSED